MSNLTLAKDSQAMVSYKLLSHSENLVPMIREIFGLTQIYHIKDVIWQPFCFQDKAKLLSGKLT